MKQTFMAVLIIVFMVGGLAIFGKPVQQNASAAYLRIHIRANSNSVSDQNVKYQVKQSVIDYLTPLLVEGTSVAKAKAIVKQNLQSLNQVCTSVLKQNGFSYNAKAKLTGEVFPTRSYNQLTLESGFYDALIIELGQAEGDNWWCVIYPPLCFVETNSAKVEYKSKLLEIIQHFKSKIFA